MAQRMPKNGLSLWFSCDKCAAKLLIKDSETHCDDCPPNLDSIKYNFIKDEVLYGTLDVKTVDDVKFSDKENLVFLSVGAIQLCSFGIGEWVTITLNGLPPVAKIVWPTKEKTMLSVLLLKEGLTLLEGKVKSHVVVTKLSPDIPEARTVVLVDWNKLKFNEITPDLITKISDKAVEKIYCAGNRLRVRYHGKVLTFEVEFIESYTSLENSFQQLHLDDHSKSFFKVTDRTMWKIVGDKRDLPEDLAQPNLITKIGGLDSEIVKIRDLIQLCFQQQKKGCGFEQPRGILLYGVSGTGKTLVANALAQECNAHIVNIKPPNLYRDPKSAEEALVKLYEEASEKAPTIILLDEIDAFCAMRFSRPTEAEKLLSSLLNDMFDYLNQTSHCQVVILATTNKPDAIDPRFRKPGRLDVEIEIPTPIPNARKEILTKVLDDFEHNLSGDDLANIASMTHGFVGTDLRSLCFFARWEASKRKADKIGPEDFSAALSSVKPSAMREVQIEVANVKWSDIGGQDRLKLLLRQAVEWPLKHPESFVALGVTPPKGVLMFGPPGCSKTMIAKALATESGLNFFSIKGPELFNKWVGESERAVREVFRKAKQVAPSIIFFDEIDALVCERASGSAGSVQERVVAQLLTEMDGVSPLGKVTVVAATNRPDRIDRALLRPGRLDRIVYVPLPDAATRKEIFKLNFSKMRVLDVNVDNLVAMTENFSGADINLVCKEAAWKALEENREAKVIREEHFKSGLEMVTPRTPDDLLKLYDDFLQHKNPY